MRRVCIFFFSLLLLIPFSGCSSVSGQELKPEDIIFTFQCNADVTVDGKKMQCKISRSAPGIVSVQMVSGDTKGLTFFWKDSDFSVSYNGLTAESDDCVLPKTSFAYLIKQTLDSAANVGVLTRTHGNEFSGNSSGFDFILTVEDGTSKIQKISVPKYAFTADFHDYSELGV